MEKQFRMYYEKAARMPARPVNLLTFVGAVWTTCCTVWASP